MSKVSDHHRDWLGEFAACVGFFTRLPVPAYHLEPQGFARALWAAPLAGAFPALASALVLMVGAGLNLPPLAAGGLALAAGLLVTGALHEDGLADVADGFGGGSNRARKLEIMKDSHIGTYGVAALVLSLILRTSLLAPLAPLGFWSSFLVLLAAHAASRALLPLMLFKTPNARGSGVSAGVGVVPGQSVMLALGLGLIGLLLLGPKIALFAGCLLVLSYLGVRRLALRQIGGQTGDVIGTLQQISEIAVLIAAVSILI